MFAQPVLVSLIGFVRDIDRRPVAQPAFGKLRHSFLAGIDIAAGRCARDDAGGFGFGLGLGAMQRVILGSALTIGGGDVEFQSPAAPAAAGEGALHDAPPSR